MPPTTTAQMPGAATLAPLAYAKVLELALVRPYYRRFANLSAAQKASARSLYHGQRAAEFAMSCEYATTEPLVDCWFLPLQDGTVSQVGFFTEQHTAKSIFTINTN